MKNLLKDLNSKLKQLICSHNYGLVRWFYTHGPTTNEPAYIIAKYKCLKCGKKLYISADRDKDWEEKFKDLYGWGKSR
jgi:hypothetical protein